MTVYHGFFEDGDGEEVGRLEILASSNLSARKAFMKRAKGLGWHWASLQVFISF